MPFMTISEVREATNFDATTPNCWADPQAHYIVQARPPMKGELFLTGAKVSLAEKDFAATSFPVIIGID